MLKIFVRNYDKPPATDIAVSAFTALEEISTEIINDWPSSPDRYSLAPNEIMSFRTPVTPETYRAGHGGDGLYFALKITYKYEKEKVAKSIVTGMIRELNDEGMTYTKKDLE